MNYGDNLNWFLLELANAEIEQIEDGAMEVIGEDEQGREGSTEVIITELAQAAAERIKKLEEDKKALLAFFEDKAIPAFILATHDYPVSLGPAGTLKEAEDLLLQVK